MVYHISLNVKLTQGQYCLYCGPRVWASSYGGISTVQATRMGRILYIAIQETNEKPENSLTISVFSPVDLNVTDPQGRFVSKSGSTIPGARYK